MITEAENDGIAKAFKGAGFVDELQTHTLRRGLLKIATGYSNGHTLNQIIERLELATFDSLGGGPRIIELTEKGRKLLYKLYEEES